MMKNGIKQYIKTHSSMLALLLLVLLCSVAAPHAWAAPAAMLPEGTCNNQPQFDLEHSSVVSDMYASVQAAVSGATSGLFSSVAGSVSGVGSMAITIYILMYGVLFMFGAVQVSVYDFLVRLVKVSVVGACVAGGGELYSIMTDFFEKGTNDLMGIIGQAMTGNAGLPLGAMDELINKIIAPKTLLTLITLATTGVYGPMIVIILVASFKNIIEAMLNGLWIILMALILRAILYAMAPIFIPCLLFSRTRHMFQGWLNQLVNASLQPIFVVAYFIFFFNIIDISLNGILNQATICLTPMLDFAQGAPVNSFWWRFTQNGEQYTGDWTPYDVPPIDMFQVFLLFMLAELVGRFTSIVTSLANSIAMASTKMPDMKGLLNQWEASTTSAVNNGAAKKPVSQKEAEERTKTQRAGGGRPDGSSVPRRDNNSTEYTPPGVGAPKKDAPPADRTASGTRKAIQKLAEIRGNQSLTSGDGK